MPRKMIAWARNVLCGDGTRRKIMPPKTLPELKSVLIIRSRLEDRGHKTPCRIWVGCKDSCGYGVIRYDGKNRKVTRMAWAIWRNTPITGLEVCHECDQPDCFEEAHLFTGTHMENMTDAKHKKRMGGPIGKNHYCCSFTEEVVRNLREQFKNGLNVTRELANEYKVSQAALNKIKKFKSWKHIK